LSCLKNRDETASGERQQYAHSFFGWHVLGLYSVG